MARETPGRPGPGSPVRGRLPLAAEHRPLAFERPRSRRDSPRQSSASSGPSGLQVVRYRAGLNRTTDTPSRPSTTLRPRLAPEQHGLGDRRGPRPGPGSRPRGRRRPLGSGDRPFRPCRPHLGRDLEPGPHHPAAPDGACGWTRTRTGASIPRPGWSSVTCETRTTRAA
jgi:hypothetical protein